MAFQQTTRKRVSAELKRYKISGKTPLLQSHTQTRTLTDALNRADEILIKRGTCLKESPGRSELSRSFAVRPYPNFFNSWAFSAVEYGETIALIRKHAPEISDRLKIPNSEFDFIVVGHCSLEAPFDCDPNGAYEVSHRLTDGTKVAGATVIGAEICLYSSGLLRVPTETAGFIYFYQPAEPVKVEAARLAATTFEQAGDIVCRGVNLTFPRASTSRLPDYEWVKDQETEDKLYRIANFVHSGESFVDHHGFFARETSIVQLQFLSEVEEREKIVINGPFLVFFADHSGVHAASWFDQDSFIVA